MKIGLLYPGSKKLIFNENFPPLGIAYIAAVLEKHGFEIGMLDLGKSGRKELKLFLQAGYDIIGISATSFAFGQSIEIAQMAKSYKPDVITVIGGPHVSVAMEAVLDRSCFDYAVYGEGEMTMLDIAKALQKESSPRASALSVINGLIFRDGSCVVVNPPRSRIENLDELPFPAFHLLRMEEYGMYPILTSRGCPFGCTFCAIKAIWGTLWRHRSSQNVMSELDSVRENFNRENKLFSVVDDSFNAKPQHVEEFCNSIIRRKTDIQWFCAGFRADKVSMPLALKMKEAGCIGVSIGIESANNEVLKKIKKKETIENIERGCKILETVGIPIHAQFMIGNPGDTFDTVKQSIEFARKHKFANADFYLALPYPKTELWDYVTQRGRFLKKDYTQFHHFDNEPVFETPEFSAAERIRAYTLGRKLSLRLKINEEIRTKLVRIRRMDFEDLSLKRVAKALIRLTKYFFNLSLKRHQSL